MPTMMMVLPPSSYFLVSRELLQHNVVDVNATHDDGRTSLVIASAWGVIWLLFLSD